MTQAEDGRYLERRLYLYYCKYSLLFYVETSSLLPRSRQTTDNSYGVAGAGVSQYKPPGDQWGRGDGPPRTLDRAPDPQSAQASRPGVSSATASQPLGPAGAHWPDSKGAFNTIILRTFHAVLQDSTMSTGGLIRSVYIILYTLLMRPPVLFYNTIYTETVLKK